MENIRSHIYKGIFYITLTLIAYASILSLFVRTPAIINLPSYLVILLSLLLLLPLAAFFYCLRSFFYKDKRLFYLVLAICLIIPRLLWVLLVDTRPLSDFGLYFDYAVKASQGIFNEFDKTCLVFPHRLGFPLVLSIFMQIAGNSLLAVKLLNILFSLITAILIYRLGKELFDERTGRTGSILFAVMPAQIMYNSVVASEHLFAVFFLGGILFFVLSQKQSKMSARLICCLLCAFSIAIAQFIRPLAVILIPLFLIYKIIGGFHLNNIIKSLMDIIKDIAIIAMAYAVIFGSMCHFAYQLNGIDMSKSSSGYNMLVGTNYKSNGVYNNDDAQILGEFNYDFEKVHSEAQKRAIERIISNPSDFIRLIEKKYVIFWGEDTYGALWSLSEVNNENRISRFLINHKEAPVALSQFFYIILLSFALIGAGFIIKEKMYMAALISLVFLVHVLAYMLLEIQSRYHYPAVLLILIISSYGMLKLKDILTKCRFMKRPFSSEPRFTAINRNYRN